MTHESLHDWICIAIWLKTRRYKCKSIRLLCVSADGQDVARTNIDNFDSNYFSIFDGRTVPDYLEQITRTAIVNLSRNDAGRGGRVRR